MTGNGSKALSKCRKGQHLNEISKPTELEKPLLKAFHKAAKRVQNVVGDYGRRFRLEWTRDVDIAIAAKEISSIIGSSDNPNADINAELVRQSLVPTDFKYSLTEHLARFPDRHPVAVPDGGVYWMAFSDGRMIPFACAEAKRQGDGKHVRNEVKRHGLENDNSGLGGGAGGNAIERAYKNFALWCDCVRSLPATGYFVFCESEAFKMHATNQKFAALCGYDGLNQFNVIDRSGLKYASVFVRCAKNDHWTESMMESILYIGMKAIAEEYLKCFGLEEDDAVSAA